MTAEIQVSEKAQKLVDRHTETSGCPSLDLWRETRKALLQYFSELEKDTAQWKALYYELSQDDGKKDREIDRLQEILENTTDSDARRYRWLRDHGCVWADAPFTSPAGLWSPPSVCTPGRVGDTYADAFVDGRLLEEERKK